ncbi:MAG: hypothetical protein BRC27_01085 [Nanohaloarchaea archaeon SW_10_44_10]|nr:MAG: hypothetical protein BRC27_01085 [Nanohaloarchaea archaeon SW_10_44_10]
MEKISYDQENDILYLNKGKKVQDSLDIGNLFLEFSGKNNIVGVEILNASKTVSELTGNDTTAEELENVKDAKIKMIPDNDTVFIVLKLRIAKGEEVTEESINLNFSSQALA